ncbi:hypothetical protein GW17_00034262 [Ensete ventricosum]|nr:hypothetical protein GW17_00034262 [Ensete ventricosum]
MVHWDLARRFAEGIRKLTGNTPRDCRKKTEKLTVRMPDWREFFRQLSHLGLRLNHPYPDFMGMSEFLAPISKVIWGL